MVATMHHFVMMMTMTMSFRRCFSGGAGGAGASHVRVLSNGKAAKAQNEG